MKTTTTSDSTGLSSWNVQEQYSPYVGSPRPLREVQLLSGYQTFSNVYPLTFFGGPVALETPMLYEVAIIELKDDKPTGDFEVLQIIATDMDDAKMKAAGNSAIIKGIKNTADSSVSVKVRAF